MNSILFVTLGVYMAQKQNQSPEEAAITKAFAMMLQDKAFSPVLEQMHAQGLLTQRGDLSNEGRILAKKLVGKTRNPKQLNFELLVANSTPGYNAALGLTALNKFFQQCQQGICKKVTVELEQSIAELCDKTQEFLSTVEVEQKA